ncbi:MAG TPA: hypothetical protein VF334_09175, partial [Polyangia bacterium]
MRAIAAVALGVVGLVALIASCGGPASIGQEPCSNPLGTDGGNLFAYSPAPECTSRICLVEYGLASAPADGFVAVCTRECSSDSDCVTPDRIYCPGGYGCASVAGHPRAVCVCRA